MRQWMVNPKILCDQHLLGEHVEHHMFVGTINKGTRIDGYLKNNLLEPMLLRTRHDELAKELQRRGFNHKSELPVCKLSNLSKEQIVHGIDRDSSLKDLIYRCEKCKERFEKENK